MAGITDQPFRRLCESFGADFTVSEMIAGQTELWTSFKTRHRLRFESAGAKPNIVQIAGWDPQSMAQAASLAEARGADAIDINMGCPAKKVCKKLAGSALLKDLSLVRRIISAVVAAVNVPVSLKTRTGWDRSCLNGIEAARIAEGEGIAWLTIHGRTRACRFSGVVDYDAIAAIKQAVSIPLIANGDIADPQQAAWVLKHTGADGLMIGRAARGNPWVFQKIKSGLTGQSFAAPQRLEVLRVLRRHVTALHEFYGERHGSKIARKHVAWYVGDFNDQRELRSTFNALEFAAEQRDLLDQLVRQPLALAA